VPDLTDVYTTFAQTIPHRFEIRDNEVDVAK
jgi:hypothetical protein